MKASNLQGEYCQSCAAILDDVQRNHRRVIVLDSQCLAVFQQSGDASRLEEASLPAAKAEPAKVPEEKKPEPKKEKKPVKSESKAAKKKK